jgi:hypothetical protein
MWSQPKAEVKVSMISSCAIVLLVLYVTVATSADIFLEWHVSLDFNINPVSTNQPVKIIDSSPLIYSFFFVCMIYFIHTLLANIIADVICRL